MRERLFPPRMTDAAFDAFVQETFDSFLDWNPILATAVGIHTRDHLLPPTGHQAHLDLIRKEKKVLAHLRKMDPTELSPSKRVDYRVLRSAMRYVVYEDDVLRIWESRPTGAEEVSDGLFLLFMRSFAPLPKRMESIIGRLERAPKFLVDSRSSIRKPVKLWSHIALETAQQAPMFLKIIAGAGKEALPAADAARLEEAAARTTDTLADQARWIQEDLLPKSVEQMGVGTAKFRRVVALRELSLSPEEIYAIGKRYLRESRRELERLAGQIRKGATVAEAKEIVKGDHPKDWPEALACTAKAMEDAKRFIIEHDLATIPPNEVLRVIETPSYLRHIIPFAAYNSPGHFDAVQEGLYMVTPYDAASEMLKEAYYAGVRNTAVHEGYPGHHLQLSCANLNPSLARLFAFSAVESVEGWAHYCEGMMKEHGFDDDPRTRFAQMLDQLWRAARIIIDVDLQCGKMTFDEAVDFLVTECGMERPGAVAEVKRYTYTPAYPLSYLVGKHLILQLRKDVKKGLGKAYSEKFFHDTYLYAGSIPIKYMRQIFEYKVTELQKLRKRGL